LFTLDDIDMAIEYVHSMKYSQHFIFAEVGIDITPYAAGHMVGGAVWKIVKETDEILYAVDFNHRKERHLNPSVVESLLRPSVLITDSFSVQTPSQSRTEADRVLLDTIKKIHRAKGNVLIPIDAAGTTTTTTTTMVVDDHSNLTH
jgi:cleavage and polyadenylation specificity factor subunit 2